MTMSRIEVVGNVDGWKLIGRCYLCDESTYVTMQTSPLSGNMYPICSDCVGRYETYGPKKKGFFSRLLHKISGGP